MVDFDKTCATEKQCTHIKFVKPEVVKIPSGLVTHSYCEKNPILVNQHPIGIINFCCCCCCLLNKVFICSRAWVPLFGYIIVGIITFVMECTLCWAYKYLWVKAHIWEVIYYQSTSYFLFLLTRLWWQWWIWNPKCWFHAFISQFKVNISKSFLPWAMCFSFAAALSAEVQLTTNLTWPVFWDCRFFHLPNGHCSMDVGGLPDYNSLNFNSFYI